MATIELNVEAQRLRTFDRWPVAFIDKHQLALLGFYYFGPCDLVKCYFCGIEVGMWEEGDDVLADHVRWSPLCPFICRLRTNNVPINEDLLNRMLPNVGVDVYGTGGSTPSEASRYQSEAYREIEERPSSVVSPPHEGTPSETSRYQSEASRGIEERPSSVVSPPHEGRHEFPEFAVETNRIASYTDWPKFLKQRPQDLSDAGFYYSGKGDRVCCFSCGGGLKDWEEGDSPWEQHAMWYGNCEYLKLMKGKCFIDQMAKKRRNSGATGPGREVVSPPNSTEGFERPHDTAARENLSDVSCKICYDNECNTIFLPCGHIIACAKCASSVTKCPACRQPFNSVVRAYFS